VLHSSSATNGNINLAWVQLWLPPFNSRYQMTLQDDKGIPVERTSKGKALGKPFDPKFREVNMYHGYSGRILLPHEEDDLPEALVLQDYFMITKGGKFRLAFELRAVKKAHNRIERYDLPVNVEIDIKDPEVARPEQ
jgi:hypothetical protein